MVADPLPSTTALGDWYANILVVPPSPLILFVSGRSLLPIVLPAQDLGFLGERLRDSLRGILGAIGASPEAIDCELKEMQEVSFGPTNNRRILGTINDFMFHLEAMVNERRTLADIVLRLGTFPCKPIEYRFPIEAANDLLRDLTPSEGRLH